MERIKDIVAILGGKRVLGEDVKSRPDLARLVRSGFPRQIIDWLGVRFGREIADPILHAIACDGEQGSEGRLSSSASEQILRITRIYDDATVAFGRSDLAEAFLMRPHDGLGGMSPSSLLGTVDGCRQVNQILGSVTYGLPA